MNRRRVSPALIASISVAALLFAALLSAPAQGAPSLGAVEPTYRVNFGGNYLQAPQIAVNEEGEAAVVWLQDDAGYTYIWASRSRPGSGWSDGLRISAFSPAPPREPRIAAGPNGAFLAAWIPSSAPTAFAYSWYRPTTGWDTPAQVPATPGHQIIDLRIAVDPLGNAFALVFEFSAIYANLSAIRYTAGVGWGSLTLLETAADQIEAGTYWLATDRGGNATAVWSQVENTWKSVLSNRFTPGTGWMGPVHLEADLNRSHAYPRIAGIPTGEMVAAWEYYDGAMSRIASNSFVPGIGWSGVVVVDGSTSGNTTAPTVAFAAGEAVVVWRWNNGSAYEVRATRGFGAAWEAPSTLTATGNPTESGIAGSSSQGTAVAAWTAGNSQLWASRFVAGLGWSAPTRVLEADPTYGVSSFVLAADGQGNAAFAWYKSSPTYSVYAQWVRESVAPRLRVDAPLEGATASDSSVLVTGSTEPSVRVTANGVSAAVSSNGDFSALVPLNAGANTVVVVARDAAGNENTAVRNVTFVDSVPGLQADLAAAQAQVAALQAALNATQAQLDALEANASGGGGAPADTAALEAQLNATRTNLTIAQARLDDAEASLNELKSTQSHTDSQLGDARALDVQLASQLAVLSVLAAIALLAALASIGLLIVQARRAGAPPKEGAKAVAPPQAGDPNRDDPRSP